MSLARSEKPSVDPAKLKAFGDMGYTRIEGVLARNEALAMRPLLEKAIDEDIQKWGENPAYIDHWMVHNLMVRGAPFLHLLDNPVMHAYLDAAFSPTCILYAYTSSSMPGGGSNFSRRIHVDAARLVPGYVTNVGFFVACDDITVENGAMHMLANSQWRADPPAEADFMRDAERMTLSAGDAVLFNARTWHMGGHNTTDRPRHAVTMNICRAYMKQRFDYPRLVPPDLIAQLSPKGRAFLGMDSRVPTSLEEYYVPESERLYKAGLG